MFIKSDIFKLGYVVLRTFQCTPLYEKQAILQLWDEYQFSFLFLFQWPTLEKDNEFYVLCYPIKSNQIKFHALKKKKPSS